MGFLDWFKKGRVKEVDAFPYPMKKEKGKGFKITWPWPGDNNFTGEDRD